MVLVCGIPSEKPVALLVQRLKEQNIPHVIFNQRNFENIEFHFQISEGKITGSLGLENKPYDLQKFTGIYNRLVNYSTIPEYAGKDEIIKIKCRVLHESLMQWFEVTNAKVLNKNSSMTSNMSKPFQINLIKKFGLSVPETLITNRPEEVVHFYRQKGTIIYKSASGERSIVKTLKEEDLQKLPKICWCPTQFQEYIAGDNVRVHVLGETVFASRITSAKTDYRYDQKASYTSFSLPEKISKACIKLTRSTGMHFSGIDFKYHPKEEKYYCFEMNPSPAYSHYETNCRQNISAALAQYLGC
ncbi:RimK family alpha-L-glutamate ligase [Zunongwangia sp. H14]|uniref:ATP-grasp domain-containing protein n=1 Tax=Zunongwangia sp. H14 TaxID=3240792 RepID=UPI003561DB1F